MRLRKTKLARTLTQPGVEDMDVPDWTTSPDREAVNSELKDKINEGMSRLEPSLRAAVVLRDVEGLSSAEAADVLGGLGAGTQVPSAPCPRAPAQVPVRLRGGPSLARQPDEDVPIVVTLSRSNVDIAIVCHDFERSLHFYHDIMGLEIAVDTRIPSDLATTVGLAPRGFRHVRLRAGDTLIKLMDISTPPPRRTHEFATVVRWLTFFVPDVEDTYRHLRQRDVTFLSEPSPEGVVCAVDPDGILIEFVQA